MRFLCPMLPSPMDVLVSIQADPFSPPLLLFFVFFSFCLFPLCDVDLNIFRCMTDGETNKETERERDRHNGTGKDRE